jgi:6,7-dimethyl-8-ribityllumazine synthase
VGSLRSEGLKFGVVVARFNELVTKPLLEGVLEGLERHGTARSEVDVRL